MASNEAAAATAATTDEETGCAGTRALLRLVTTLGDCTDAVIMPLAAAAAAFRWAITWDVLAGTPQLAALPPLSTRPVVGNNPVEMMLPPL